jgi:hypothetical protein
MGRGNGVLLSPAATNWKEWECQLDSNSDSSHSNSTA